MQFAASQMIERTTVKPKDMLTLLHYTKDEIIHYVETGIALKKQKVHPDQPLAGKVLGMIFEKPSTRTRVSFEAGMLQLGGNAIFLSRNDLQMGRGETIEDTAKVLSEYVDAIMIRAYEQSTVETLANHASVPVINGLTNEFHPCQALADLMTIKEKKGKLAGNKLVYVGDGNNVANSLMIAGAKVGMDVTIACPEGYEPPAKFIAKAKQVAAAGGSRLEINHDPVAAVKGADVIYSDVWTSMGDEGEELKRKADFYDYQVNKELLIHAKEDYTFLHCLPAHRGEEVAADVIDGPHSAVFQQAGNRLHAQKAVLIDLMTK